MGSAHPLVKVNVSFKFEENPSVCGGGIIKINRDHKGLWIF